MRSLPISLQKVPELATPRLRLRGHRVEDFAAMCALWGDPEVARYTLGRPQTSEEVWSRLLRYAGHWSLLGFGYWVVEEKATGDFVGEAGLCDLQRAIDPPIDAPEIGWSLLPAHHGKGYATEAARAILQWGEGEPLNATDIACIMVHENAASQRVAAKLGFARTHTVTYRGELTDVLYASL
jgi:RimJ/RimL family protein N-acetyltransferase